MAKAYSATESSEQTAVLEWCRLMEGRYPALKLMFHIPNEGKRSRRTGARLKAEGLKSGVPDLCLPVPSRGYHGLFIEMKTQTGKPTKEQEEWICALNEQGYFACVCYGCDAAIKTIKAYLEM